jgi:hypothetical protein
MRLAANGRAHRVGHAENQSATGLAVAKSQQSVGRLT